MAPTRSLRVADPPQGFHYTRDFVTRQEERELLSRLGELDLSAPVLHGTAARRLTGHFGWLYGYERGRLEPGPPIPEYLLDLRGRAAQFARIEPEELVEVLVTRYPPGAGIGWHRDAPMFGSSVIGISLESGCRMRFRRPKGSAYELYEIELEPRSAYLMRGSARWQWQHGIPSCEEERYSITFRTLKSPPAQTRQEEQHAPSP